ncbi:MAG: hypothetical protein HY369_02140 [Candidatus Aenigmarchaeota archaeon]|nr:hypothetical protein [Candidatus Aenigmarchaeota archaeon]
MEDNGFKGLVIFLLGIILMYTTYANALVSTIADVPLLTTFERHFIIGLVVAIAGPLYYWYYKGRKAR